MTQQVHMRFPNLNTHLYTDTMFAAAKLLSRGNKCAQVFTNGTGYDLFYPLKKEALASEVLNEVIQTVGVPKELAGLGWWMHDGNIWAIWCGGKRVPDKAVSDGAIQWLAKPSRGRCQRIEAWDPKGNAKSTVAQQALGLLSWLIVLLPTTTTLISIPFV